MVHPRKIQESDRQLIRDTYDQNMYEGRRVVNGVCERLAKKFGVSRTIISMIGHRNLKVGYFDPFNRISKRQREAIIKVCAENKGNGRLRPGICLKLGKKYGVAGSTISKIWRTRCNT